MEQQSSVAPFAKGVVAGACAGGAYVFPLGQIVWAAKVMIQKGEANWSEILTGKVPVRNYFAGMRTYLVSVVPATAVQVGGYSLLGKVWYGSETPSALGQMVCSSAAGLVSGLVSGPTEAVMQIQQRLHKQGRPSGVGAVRVFAQRHGLAHLVRGTYWCCLRDGGYTACLLGLKQLMFNELNRLGFSDWQAEAGAVGGASIAGLLITQPFDVMRTMRQEHGWSLSQAVKGRGVASLWAGGSARFSAIALSVAIIPNVEERVHALLDRWF